MEKPMEIQGWIMMINGYGCLVYFTILVIFMELSTGYPLGFDLTDQRGNV